MSYEKPQLFLIVDTEELEVSELEIAHHPSPLPDPPCQ